jgi:hypothetical protein
MNVVMFYLYYSTSYSQTCVTWSQRRPEINDRVRQAAVKDSFIKLDLYTAAEGSIHVGR